METSIGLDGVNSGTVSSFDFDVSRFNLDDFDNLSINEISPKQVEIVTLSQEQEKNVAKSPVDELDKEQLPKELLGSIENNFENSKRAFVSDDCMNFTEEPELIVLVNENKKPKKGILKPSSPPVNFAARSSTLFRQQKDRILERLSSLNRGSAYLDLNDPSLRNELHPKDLKRVRFSFPLGSTSFILPNSCKITSPTTVCSFSNLDSPFSPDDPSFQLSIRDTIDLYLSFCRSREEMQNDRLIQLLEEAENTQQKVDSLNMSGESLSMRNIASFSDGIDLLKGLTRLELEDCDLDNDCIRLLCSNFLQSDRLVWLSLANNPKIRSEGFRFLATYINQSKKLKFLDLSCNIIDAKAARLLARGVMAPFLLNTSEEKIEDIGEVSSPTSLNWVDALNTEPSCCLEELRLNECSLHSAELKIICQGLSRSKLRSLSLCGNKISYLGASALVSLLAGSSESEPSHLAILDLSMNQLKTSGLEPLLSPLSNPQSRLEELNLGRNGIDELGMSQLFSALKTNKKLHRVDLSSNPVCGPSIEGLLSLKACLSFNHNLRVLFLSDTGMTSEGAITLAEVLPESKSLARLDISQNSSILMAGLLALSVSARLNFSITCLDVSIPPNEPELASLSQDMLNTCIRNTQLTDDLTFGKNS